MTSNVAAPLVPRSKRERAAGAPQVAWMAIPAFLMFALFGLIPVAGVLALSFSSWDGIGPVQFAGLDSWTSVLSDPALPQSILVTLEVMIFGWIVQTPLSIIIGTFLAGHQRYRETLSVLYFVPLLLSGAAIAIAFKALLDPNFGLGPGLGLDILTQDWLGKPYLALAVVIFISSWHIIPFHALIYQGGVRQIPVSMYEAAVIDGAGRLRQFFSITLPQLKNTFITSSTLMLVGGLTSFDLIFVLTAGGPGDATRTLALSMYQLGFKANLMGPATAIAVMLVIIGLGVSLLLQRLGGKDGSSQLEGA